MLQHPFAIEFHYTEETNTYVAGTSTKYQAVITTLSKSFQLFKVTGIRKITCNGITEIEACYHLTPHPISEEKNESWKDALTRSSDSFLQAIGKAIEKHLYTSKEIAPYLN